MEVFKPSDSENYTLVGGGKSHKFSIGNSASAFRILSETLYSDKRRAVVREILCNAHDAHIDAGVDRPIEVKVTETELSIRDFGKGIPDDRIAEIYTTYFNSNKQERGELTGGFGLGSKAPFAYTDHFVVESRHEGKMTVYAAHIGDEKSGGAPSMVIMAQVPTTESGVTVRVPITTREDSTAFEWLVKRIARQGEIPTILNDAPIELIGIKDRYGSGFTVVTNLQDSSLTERCLIKVGSVLYPLNYRNLDQKAKYAITKLTDILAATKYGASDKILVLFAPPSSVSIVPSREAISYDERTINFLNKFVVRTLGSSISLDNEVNEIVRKYIRTVSRGAMQTILLYENRVEFAGMLGLKDPKTDNWNFKSRQELIWQLALREFVGQTNNDMYYVRPFIDRIEKSIRQSVRENRKLYLRSEGNAEIYSYNQYRRDKNARTLPLQYENVRYHVRRFVRAVSRVDAKLIENSRLMIEGTSINLRKSSVNWKSNGAYLSQSVFKFLKHPTVYFASSFTVASDEANSGMVITGSVPEETRKLLQAEFDKFGFDVKTIAKKPKEKVVEPEIELDDQDKGRLEVEGKNLMALEGTIYDSYSKFMYFNVTGKLATSPLCFIRAKPKVYDFVEGYFALDPETKKEVRKNRRVKRTMFTIKADSHSRLMSMVEIVNKLFGENTVGLVFDSKTEKLAKSLNLPEFDQFIADALIERVSTSTDIGKMMFAAMAIVYQSTTSGTGTPGIFVTNDSWSVDEKFVKMNKLDIMNTIIALIKDINNVDMKTRFSVIGVSEEDFLKMRKLADEIRTLLRIMSDRYNFDPAQEKRIVNHLRHMERALRPLPSRDRMRKFLEGTTYFYSIKNFQRKRRDTIKDLMRDKEVYRRRLMLEKASRKYFGDDFAEVHETANKIVSIKTGIMKYISRYDLESAKPEAVNDLIEYLKWLNKETVNG